MLASIKRLVGAYLIFLLLSTSSWGYEAPASPAPRPFQYDTDTFSFANETVWNYANGTAQADASSEKQKRDYTRRCFVVTRAAVQFWKFARFDSSVKPLARDRLAGRIREVTGRSVWLPALPPDRRIVFPGYANLREISASDPSIFQANIGLGWPVYSRCWKRAHCHAAIPGNRSAPEQRNLPRSSIELSDDRLDVQFSEPENKSCRGDLFGEQGSGPIPLPRLRSELRPEPETPRLRLEDPDVLV